MRAFATTILLVLLAFNAAEGQRRSDATERGAWLASVSAAFSSAGGDLYENSDGDRETLIMESSTMIHFVADGLAFGVSSIDTLARSASEGSSSSRAPTGTSCVPERTSRPSRTMSNSRRSAGESPAEPGLCGL